MLEDILSNKAAFIAAEQTLQKHISTFFNDADATDYALAYAIVCETYAMTKQFMRDGYYQYIPPEMDTESMHETYGLDMDTIQSLQTDRMIFDHALQNAQDIVQNGKTEELELGADVEDDINTMRTSNSGFLKMLILDNDNELTESLQDYCETVFQLMPKPSGVQ